MPDDEIEIAEKLPEAELDKLNSDELDQLYDHIVDRTGMGLPQDKEEHNAFSFLKRIIDVFFPHKPATNVDEPELAAMRALLNAANVLKTKGYQSIPEFLIRKADIIGSTSLGKEGFLIKAAITQRKYLTTDARKKESGATNKGWFKRKEQSQEKEF